MDNYYSGKTDNQGVHIDTGIPKKAFYLCCLEIRLAECALIWFETLKVLRRTADFNDMLDVILRVTEELQREDKVSSSALETVANSFASVGLIKVIA